MSDPVVIGGRGAILRVARVAGAIVGYGLLAAFLCLVGIQIYRWFRDGEWTHFGVIDALRSVLTRCCVQDGDTGRLASLVHWFDAPVTGLGLHKVLELLPASLALFAISVLGNSIYIYCSDRLAAAGADGNTADGATADATGVDLSGDSPGDRATGGEPVTGAPPTGASAPGS